MVGTQSKVQTTDYTHDPDHKNDEDTLDRFQAEAELRFFTYSRASLGLCIACHVVTHAKIPPNDLHTCQQVSREAFSRRVSRPSRRRSGYAWSFHPPQHLGR